MSKLIKCNTCKGNVSINAQQCPHCGEPEFNYQEIKAKQQARIAEERARIIAKKEREKEEIIQRRKEADEMPNLSDYQRDKAAIEEKYKIRKRNRAEIYPSIRRNYVRIVNDLKNPGKFIVRDLETDRIGFIKNPTDYRLKIEDIYEIKILEDKEKFFTCKLIKFIDPETIRTICSPSNTNILDGKDKRVAFEIIEIVDAYIQEIDGGNQWKATYNYRTGFLNKLSQLTIDHNNFNVKARDYTNIIDCIDGRYGPFWKIGIYEWQWRYFEFILIEPIIDRNIRKLNQSFVLVASEPDWSS